MSKSRYEWTLKMIVIGFLILMINFLLLGRVSLTPIYFSFPYSLLLVSVFDINLLGISLILGLLQYPIYGLILDKYTKKMTAFVIILISHLIVSFIALQFQIQSFK